MCVSRKFCVLVSGFGGRRSPSPRNSWPDKLTTWVSSRKYWSSLSAAAMVIHKHENDVILVEDLESSYSLWFNANAAMSMEWRHHPVFVPAAVRTPMSFVLEMKFMIHTHIHTFKNHSHEVLLLVFLFLCHKNKEIVSIISSWNIFSMHLLIFFGFTSAKQKWWLYSIYGFMILSFFCHT